MTDTDDPPREVQAPHRATPRIGIGILGFGGFAMFAAQQFAQVPGAALRCIAGTHREASLACARAVRPCGRATRGGAVRDARRAARLHRHPAISPPRASRGALRAGSTSSSRSLWRSRWSRPTSSCPCARDSAAPPRHQLDAALQPTVRADQGARGLEASRRRAARIPSRTMRATKGLGRTTGSGIRPRAAGSSSSTACISSTCSRAGSAAAPSNRRDACCARIGDRGAGLLHRSLRRRAGDVLPRLYASGPDGPAGAPPPLRARRRDTARVDPRRRPSCARRWTRGRPGRSRRCFRARAIDVEQLYAASERAVHARHKTYDAYQRITLTSAPATKMTVYGDLLRAMLADQLAFIAEPSHTRVDHGRQRARITSHERASDPARGFVMSDARRRVSEAVAS